MTSEAADHAVLSVEQLSAAGPRDALACATESRGRS
jgi:hypothetical protein